MLITPDDELGFRALTVRQPWASQIATGAKSIEYRSWSTEYRGDMLITASANADAEAGRSFAGPLGCAVCIVTLVDVRDPGDVYEWALENPRPVKNVRTKGTQLLWTVSRELTIKLGIQW